MLKSEIIEMLDDSEFFAKVVSIARDYKSLAECTIVTNQPYWDVEGCPSYRVVSLGLDKWLEYGKRFNASSRAIPFSDEWMIEDMTTSHEHGDLILLRATK